MLNICFKPERCEISLELRFITETCWWIACNADDPVNENAAEEGQHSILKFLSDIYSSPTTSAMFYTNDAKVLIDIIIRQLSDLPPGSQVYNICLLSC